MKNLLFIFALLTLALTTSCSSENERRHRENKNRVTAPITEVAESKVKTPTTEKVVVSDPFVVNTFYFSDTIANYKKDVKAVIGNMKKDADLTTRLIYQNELIEVYSVQQKHFDEPFYIVAGQTAGEGGAYFHITKVFDVKKTKDEVELAYFCTDYQSDVKQDIEGKLKLQNGVLKVYLNNKIVSSITLIE